MTGSTDGGGEPLPGYFFEQALAAVGQAVVGVDAVGHVVYWSPSAEVLYGYPAEAALGRPVFDLIVPAETLAAARERGRRLSQGEDYAGDWDVCDEQGRRFTVFVTSTAVRDDAGRLVARVAVMHDVTERMTDARRQEDPAARPGLTGDLRAALAGGSGLTLAYQPIVDLATGRVTGVEALARWNHPERGLVPPTEFIAVADAAGLAVRFDRWAMTRACEDLARFHTLVDGSLRMSVNLSASSLSDDELERWVLATLAANGLSGDHLVLEITENALMDSPERARETLARLRAHGISACIDDFGTGYSSLGYLTQLPVGSLKVDRTFIEGITEDADSLAIAASIIDLSRAIRLTVIAAGVENADQLALLHKLGCTSGQGFLWGPGVPADELVELLQSLPGGRFETRSGKQDGRIRAVPKPRERVTAENGLNQLIRMHREGASITTIAAALNGEGYRTASGLRWHRSTVARVISDIAYPSLWQGAGAR